ncbi:MAG TPA: hypothetical protein EYM39_10065 [Candidatus Latescibacteria bacterium]|nr:hypothetical protein [Candidatus Latescibacterota bacterium]
MCWEVMEGTRATIVTLNEGILRHYRRTRFRRSVGDRRRLVRAANVSGNDRAFSGTISDTLGLISWTIPWKTYRDEGDNLHFDLSRPGKKYTVHVALRLLGGVLRPAKLVAVRVLLHRHLSVDRLTKRRLLGWVLLGISYGNAGVIVLYLSCSI